MPSTAGSLVDEMELEEKTPVSPPETAVSHHAVEAPQPHCTLESNGQLDSNIWIKVPDHKNIAKPFFLEKPGMESAAGKQSLLMIPLAGLKCIMAANYLLYSLNFVHQT